MAWGGNRVADAGEVTVAQATGGRRGGGRTRPPGGNDQLPGPMMAGARNAHRGLDGVPDLVGLGGLVGLVVGLSGVGLGLWVFVGSALGEGGVLLAGGGGVA